MLHCEIIQKSIFFARWTKNNPLTWINNCHKNVRGGSGSRVACLSYQDCIRITTRYICFFCSPLMVCNVYSEDNVIGLYTLQTYAYYIQNTVKSVLSLKTVNKQLDVPISALRLGYPGQSQYKIRYIQLFVYRL